MSRDSATLASRDLSPNLSPSRPMDRANRGTFSARATAPTGQDRK